MKTISFFAAVIALLTPCLASFGGSAGEQIIHKCIWGDDIVAFSVPTNALFLKSTWNSRADEFPVSLQALAQAAKAHLKATRKISGGLNLMATELRRYGFHNEVRIEEGKLRVVRAKEYWFVVLRFCVVQPNGNEAVEEEATAVTLLDGTIAKEEVVGRAPRTVSGNRSGPKAIGGNRNNE